MALILLIDFGFRRGTVGDNRYGPDPLAAQLITAVRHLRSKTAGADREKWRLESAVWELEQ